LKELDFYTVDILRQLNHPNSKSQFLPVKQLINRYFQEIIPPKFADAITTQLTRHEWVFSVEEEDAVMINESGSEYLFDIMTPEYILDRVLEYLRNASLPEVVSEITRKLRLDLNKEDQELLSAKLDNSGMVDVKPFGYYSSFKINSRGRNVLEKHGRYSIYMQAKERTVAFSSHHINDLSELTVLAAFANNLELSWADFTIKGIFHGIQNGTPRASLLGDIIRGLHERGFTQELEIRPATWRINETGMNKYYDMLYETNETIPPHHMAPSNLDDTFELIFQRHKEKGGTLIWHKETLKPIIPENWQTAREMMVKKEVIFWSGISQTKKTTIHPDVLNCLTYKEALERLTTQVTSPPGSIISNTINMRDMIGSSLQQSNSESPQNLIDTQKEKPLWYKNTFAKYILWPVVVAAIGALLTWGVSTLSK
jgi:hypothetical protein